MSIKLEITDPQLLDPLTVRRTAAYLLSLIGDQLSASPVQSRPIEAPPVVEPDEIAPPPMGELDDHGTPWNSEFHSRAKTKLADGSWRLKRGVDAYEPHKADITPPPAPIPVAPPVEDFIVEIFEPVEDFPALMDLLTKAVAKKQITMPEVIEITTALGAPNVPALGTLPGLVPFVMQAIRERIQKNG